MNIDTLLLRQIHPSWMKIGRVTSQAFRPTQKDARKLSVSDGDMVTPQVSWERHVNRGHPSVGVLAVTVQECKDVELTSQSCPILPDQPEHAIIDFSDVPSNSQVEKLSKHLTVMATHRNWCFLPDK